MNIDIDTGNSNHSEVITSVRQRRKRNPILNALIGLLVGLAVGAFVSVIAAFAQSAEIYVQGHQLFIGIPLAILLVLFTELWLAQQLQTQLASVGVVISWAVSTFVMSQATSNGDYAILKGSTSAHYYLLIGAVVLGGAATMRPLKRADLVLPTSSNSESDT